MALTIVTSAVNFTQNQRFEFPYDVASTSSPIRSNEFSLRTSKFESDMKAKELKAD